MRGPPVKTRQKCKSYLIVSSISRSELHVRRRRGGWGRKEKVVIDVRNFIKNIECLASEI